MPVPSRLLIDSVAGKKPAQKELGFYLDSLMPLLGRAAQSSAAVVGVGETGPITSLVAGAGMTGGGVFGEVTLNVGAGNGIAVGADSVAVQLAANSGLAFPGGSLAVGAGTGILVSGGTVAVDQAFTPTWTGGHTFHNTITSNNITPEATDTYDLGTSLKLWRKGWLSELDAILFAQNTITLLGGWFMVSKDEGKLPADSGLGTTIDFGKAMTPNDFVLFRAALMVEYMKVGTLVGGTTYNVTRNLDGTGANNWVAGSVFAVLGQSGDGRIELNAYDTPRLSMILQGATYNAQTEVLRLGDLVGWGPGGSPFGNGYGIAIGDPAGGNYMTYSATAAPTGFAIHTGTGKVLIDSSGITITADGSNYIFWKAGATEAAQLWANLTASASSLTIGTGISTDLAQTMIAARDNASNIASVEVISNSGGTMGGAKTFVRVSGQNGTRPFAGMIVGDSLTGGTATPTSMLDVRGQGIVTGALAAAYGLQVINTSATGHGLFVRGGADASHYALVVQNAGGGANLLLVKGDGEVAVPVGSIDLGAGVLKHAGTQVVGARVTGYAPMTGTPDKGTVYATSTVTLAQLAGRVMQLQADITNSHGLIGA